MTFIDSIKNFFSFKSHPSVDKAQSEIEKTAKKDNAGARMFSVPNVFADPPLMQMWQRWERRYSNLKPSYYELARHSHLTRYSDPRVGDSYETLHDKSMQRNENGRPFDIEISPDMQTKWMKQFDEWAEATQLYATAIEASDYALKLGEIYYEVLIDTTKKPFSIAEFRRIPGPHEGFDMIGPDAEGNYFLIEHVTSKVVQSYRGFQVIPFKRGAREREVGKPILASTWKYYNNLELMESVMPMMRQYRAGVTRVFEYKEDMSENQFRQMSDSQKSIEREKGKARPFSDIHTTAKVHGLNDSTASIWEIRDIEYMLMACLSAIGTPLYLLSTMTDRVPNFAVADIINDNFVRGRIKRVESMTTGYIPRQRFDGANNLDGMGILKALGLQAYLWGVKPQEFGFELKWPNKLSLTAEEVDATQKMYESDDLSSTEYLRRMGNVDYKQQLEQKQKDRELAEKFQDIGNVEPREAEELVRIAREIVTYAESNGVAK